MGLREPRETPGTPRPVVGCHLFVQSTQHGCIGPYNLGARAWTFPVSYLAYFYSDVQCELKMLLRSPLPA